MKKRVLFIMAAASAAMAACTLGAAGCLIRINNHHRHTFNRQIVEEQYLAAEATCTDKAVYYYSCECGEIGMQTFEYGEAKGHAFDNQLAQERYLISGATCTARAIYYYSCDCGERGAEGFEYGKLKAHAFNNGKCTVCTAAEPTQGLTYALNDDKTAYIATGLGTATQTEITIADQYNGMRVTGIDEGAFRNCSNITGIVIPASITEIGNNAFNGCSGLNSIAVANGNPAFKSEDDCLLTKDGKTLILGCKNSVIPAGVTSIGAGAFRSCDGLKNITIPDGVTDLGDYAFSGCDGLTSITIPDGVTTVGDHAFYNCGKLIIYCKAATKPEGWSGDWNSGNCAVIWDCEHNDSDEQGNAYAVVGGLRYALKDGAATVTYQASDLSGDIVVPKQIEYNSNVYTVTSIGVNAFNGYAGITGISLPSSVTSIGGNAFAGCSGLNSIAVEAGNIAYKSVNNCLLTLDGSTLVLGCKNSVIPSGVLNIGVSAFAGCSGLTSIVLPATVTGISMSAFEGCVGLTSIVIPQGVTRIGMNAFAGCTNLNIYCEAESKPSGWVSYWNPLNRRVVWGYKAEN